MEKILGFDYKNKYPVLDIGRKRGHTDYIDFISEDEVTSPIMIGVDIYRRPFVVMKILAEDSDDKTITFMQTFFQRYSDDYNGLWVGCGHGGRQLLETSGGMKHDQFVFLNKLVNGEVLNEVPRPVYDDNTNKNYRLYCETSKTTSSNTEQLSTNTDQLPTNTEQLPTSILEPNQVLNQDTNEEGYLTYFYNKITSYFY